jgi:RNA polymerase sigma-70 factor (ECF subfamily)
VFVSQSSQPATQREPSAGDVPPAGVPTDEELMFRFVRSVADAPFEELIRRYGKPAWHVAAALLGAGAAAEDAVQEAFLHVIRARATYRPGASFRNWFYAILRNVCCDQLRRPVEAPATDDDSGAPAIECDPAATVLFREQAAAAWRALGELPAHEREVLALRFHGGLDFTEIARCCGITSIAARQRASRGLDELRRRLSGDPVTSSDNVRKADVEAATRRQP